MASTSFIRKKRDTSTAMQAVRRRLPFVKTCILTAEQDHKGFIPEFLTLRKRVFVDDLGWDIPHSAEFEAEQYDRSDSVYVIAYDSKEGGVMGGARLLNTVESDAKGHFSYMIRDAFLGRLPGLPSEICDKAPPTHSGAWEMTRLVSFGNSKIGARILQASDEFLSHQNVESCLFLGSPAFMRMAKKMGYTIRQLGPVQENEDGRFVAFATDVLSDTLKKRTLQ